MKNNSQRNAREVSRGQAKRNAASRKSSLRMISCFESATNFSAQALRGLCDDLYAVLDPDFTEEPTAQVLAEIESTPKIALWR